MPASLHFYINKGIFGCQFSEIDRSDLLQDVFQGKERRRLMPVIGGLVKLSVPDIPHDFHFTIFELSPSVIRARSSHNAIVELVMNPTNQSWELDTLEIDTSVEEHFINEYHRLIASIENGSPIRIHFSKRHSLKYHLVSD